MIVKNPTGQTIVYAFASLTLAPGGTAEIDNSFIENVEFQKAQQSGTITVIKYEKDYINNTVVISIGEAPNTPSNNQKGAMVGANTPTVLNPFATIKDLCFNEFNLKYEDSHTVKIVGINSKFITIGHTNIILDTVPSFDTLVDVTIDASGNLTTDVVPPSTLVYAYLNANKSLRLSLASPAYYENGLYLNSNMTWKFVGYVHINAVNQLESIGSVLGTTGNDSLYNLTGTFLPTNPSVIENIPETKKCFIILPGGTLQLTGQILVNDTTLNNPVELYINGEKVKTVQNENQEIFIYNYKNTTLGIIGLFLQLGLKGTVLSYSVDLSTIRINYTWYQNL